VDAIHSPFQRNREAGEIFLFSRISGELLTVLRFLINWAERPRTEFKPSFLGLELGMKV